MAALKDIVKDLPAELQPVASALWEQTPAKERGAIAGAAIAGKSMRYNQLIQTGKDRASVSPAQDRAARVT